MSRFPHVRFLFSAAQASQFPPDQGSEVAIAGRSNAGKSSAINAITGRKALARTSKTPGQTRLLNFFEIEPGQRVVDLPGYGYATAPEAERRTWAPMTEALRTRQALKGLFLIVDSRRGVTDADQELIDWADPATLHVHVLLSKADKLTKQESLLALKEARAALHEQVTVQLFSAHRGQGVDEAQRVLTRWLRGRE